MNSKTILLSILFFITGTTQINSQSIKLGLAGNFLVGNKYYNYQLGPSLMGKYSFESLPVSMIVGIRFYTSELDNDYLPGYSNNVFSFGASIYYNPIHWAIEPYVGAGVYYNSNRLKPGGMPASVNGAIISVKNADNNISGEITVGITLSANDPLNIVVELTQSFSKPAILVASDEVNNTLNERSIKIFNSLFIRVGILFKI